MIWKKIYDILSDNPDFLAQDVILYINEDGRRLFIDDAMIRIGSEENDDDEFLELVLNEV